MGLVPTMPYVGTPVCRQTFMVADVSGRPPTSMVAAPPPSVFQSEVFLTGNSQASVVAEHSPRAL